MGVGGVIRGVGVGGSDSGGGSVYGRVGGSD